MSTSVIAEKGSAPAQKSSRISGFYRLSVDERRRALTAAGWLTPDGAAALARHAGFEEAVADTMSENVIGIHGLPLGLGLNFRINGQDYVAPMSVEEPSVVAAASNAARLALSGGGFSAEADEPLMIAQIQLLDVADFATARDALLAVRADLIDRANSVIPEMVRRGGGVRELDVRLLEETASGCMMAVHLIVDTRDAMGANILNTLAEAMANPVQKITGGRVGLRILSNLADRRKVRIRVRLPVSALEGEGFTGDQVRDGIVAASRFAELDAYRACTHNKGIMNGVDAVIMATGNDWRAVEAGAHAFAARNGRYEPLATWHVNEAGDLVGVLELPLALGIVGGAVRAHPGVRLALEIAGVGSAQEPSLLAGAVGLASNLAALKALASTGIQKGHMALHARSVAAEVGAVGDEIEKVALELAREGDYRPARAKAVLKQIRLGLVVHE
jgi:hydroxymethylglutaryl-CoA reductase